MKFLNSVQIQLDAFPKFLARVIQCFFPTKETLRITGQDYFSDPSVTPEEALVSSRVTLTFLITDTILPTLHLEVLAQFPTSERNNNDQSGRAAIASDYRPGGPCSILDAVSFYTNCGAHQGPIHSLVVRLSHRTTVLGSLVRNPLWLVSHQWWCSPRTSVGLMFLPSGRYI